MVHFKSSVIVSIFTLHALVDPVIAFSPCPTRNFGSHTFPTHLNLHPDQAPELEAAATEFMKTQSENTEDTGTSSDHTEQDLIDDTNNNSSSPLSATSSSIKPARKWWSTSFSSFVRRHGRSS